MFSIEFLHAIRTAELGEALTYIAPASCVLEIGGGTGFQARLLHEAGHSVECIDRPGSTYAGQRVFAVRDYDGARIPYRDGAFEAVFSSNVLEHIPDLPPLLGEIRRVLKPGGRCIHIMPSPAWRLWTIATHYPNLPLLLWGRGRGDNPFPAVAQRSLPHLLLRAAWPGPHGESGTMLGEIRLFSRKTWLARFAALGFAPVAVRPVGLFYTGNMLLGPHLSIAARRRIAPFLGNAATLYVLETR